MVAGGLGKTFARNKNRQAFRLDGFGLIQLVFALGRKIDREQVINELTKA